MNIGFIWILCLFCAESKLITSASSIGSVFFFVFFYLSVALSHTLPVCVCVPDVPLALNANGGDLSSAPSCGEKQYSTDWHSLHGSGSSGGLGMLILVWWSDATRKTVLLVRNLPPSTSPDDSSNLFCAESHYTEMFKKGAFVFLSEVLACRVMFCLLEVQLR